MTKKSLREKMLFLRAKQEKQFFDAAAQITIANILQHDLWRNASEIATFVSMEKEFPTWGLIEQAWREQKKVMTPKITGRGQMIFVQINKPEDLQNGHFGIMEPIENKEAILSARTLMLLPGLAFDISGYRLGYGGGYYDRYLGGMKRQPLKIGLCQQWQVLDALPHDNYDQQVDGYFTENGLTWIRNY